MTVHGAGDDVRWWRCRTRDDYNYWYTLLSFDGSPFELSVRGSECEGRISLYARQDKLSNCHHSPLTASSTRHTNDILPSLILRVVSFTSVTQPTANWIRFMMYFPKVIYINNYKFNQKNMHINFRIIDYKFNLRWKKGDRLWWLKDLGNGLRGRTR